MLALWQARALGNAAAPVEAKIVENNLNYIRFYIAVLCSKKA
jgi:hypothetical protein